MDKSPVALFVYNRPEHTKRVIRSLAKNAGLGDTKVFVFSDGPRSSADVCLVKAVRQQLGELEEIADTTIILNDTNLGLANSVISGVSTVIDKHGKIIVVEDDLELGKDFLQYMNYCLNNYVDEEIIFSVGGYTPNIKIPKSYKHGSFLSYRCCSWGWATWSNRWLKCDWNISDSESFFRNKKDISLFNRGGDDMTNLLRMQLEGKIDSWAIRWDYAHFRNSSYCIRPTKSLVINFGLDGSGTHCGITRKYDVPATNIFHKIPPTRQDLTINHEINANFAFFCYGRPRSFNNFLEILKAKLGNKIRAISSRLSNLLNSSNT
jgi:hypothetical protein